MCAFFVSSSSISLEVKFGGQSESYFLPSLTSYKDFVERVAQRFQLEPSSVKFVGWKKKPPTQLSSVSLSDLVSSHDSRVKLLCIGSTRAAHAQLAQNEDKHEVQSVVDAMEEEDRQKEEEREEAERIRREEAEEEREQQRQLEEERRQRQREEEIKRRRELEMQRVLQEEKQSTASVTFTLKATTDRALIAAPLVSTSTTALSSSSFATTATSSVSSSASSGKLFPVHLPRNLLAHVISAGVAFPLTFRVTLSTHNEELCRAMQESLKSHLVAQAAAEKKTDSQQMDIEGQSDSSWRTAEYFRSSGVCYASVADFDVHSESHAVTNSELLEYLGASEGAVLKLTSVILAKGKSIRLKVLNENDWLEVAEEERKALLEWTLRHQQHIFPGAIVTISAHLAAPLYRFLCVKTDPDDQPINITDIDLNTEIVTQMDSKAGELPTHTTLTVLEENQNSSAEQVYKGDLPKDSCRYFTFAANDASFSYVIDLKAVSGDPDLYVSHSSCRLLPSLPLRPGPTCFQWSANSKGSDRLILSSDDSKFFVGTYFVSVHAFGEDAKFELSVSKRQKSTEMSHVATSSAVNSGSSLNDAFVVCENCKKNIPQRSFALHESQCRRMNVWCDQCSTVVPIREKAKHDELNHTPILCLCGESFNVGLYLIHAEQACPLRLVPCVYCPLWLELRRRGEHQAECGNHTAFCKTCHAQFKRKTIKRHIVQTHSINSAKTERDITWLEYY